MGWACGLYAAYVHGDWCIRRRGEDGKILLVKSPIRGRICGGVCGRGVLGSIRGWPDYNAQLGSISDAG